MVNNLNNIETDEDIHTIKNDMDKMLTGLGLDPNKLNEKMEELNKKFSKPE